MLTVLSQHSSERCLLCETKLY